MRYYVCVRRTTAFADDYTVSLNGNGHPVYTPPGIGSHPLKFVVEEDAEKYAAYAQEHLPRVAGQHESIDVREMEDERSTLGYVCVRSSTEYGRSASSVALSGGGKPVYAEYDRSPVKFVEHDDAVKFAGFAERHLSKLPGQDERISVWNMEYEG